jgi:pyrimidine operon attenuation protein/uracil phosphoribosyltransferase
MPPSADLTLVDAAGVALAVGKLGDLLAEALGGDHGAVFLAGIPTRGVILARRLKNELARHGIEAGCGAVDIAMYRDDLGLRGGVTPLRGTELPMGIDKWSIVLVDDVQQTGRTARAAIEAVLGFGRPRRILLAVLADRGGREIPIRPDFTALELSARPGAKVRVRFAETDDGTEGVFEE